MRARLRLALVLLGLLAAGPASAAPLLLDFTYHGVLGRFSAGTLDLGNGTMEDLSGVTFTATGHMTDGVDLFNDTDQRGCAYESCLGIGVFAATETFDFGALGTFTTDPGAARFIQVPTCWGWACGNDYSMMGQAFLWDTRGNVDPGVPTLDGWAYIAAPIFNAEHFTNAAGQALTFTEQYGPYRSSAFSVEVTAANPVPEPAPWILVGVGGMGLCWWVRRRQQPA